MSGNPYDGPVSPDPPPKPPFDEGIVEYNGEARNWAMFAHLASLAGYTGIPLANLIGPLVVWLIKKDEMPFVNDQGKEAINFQISVTLYLVVSGVLVLCAGIGIVGLIGVGIFSLIFTIIAAISAASGKRYRYPLTIRLVS